MGLRDTLSGMARLVAAGASDALAAWADDSLAKAQAQEKTQGRGAVDPGEESQETGPGGDAKDTPENAPLPDSPSDLDPKALMVDPFAVVEALGYRDRPSQVTYGMLKAIVYRMPIVQAIIKLRVDQVASFAQPARDKYQLGYKVVTRESEKEPTKAEQDWGAQAENMIFRTGVTENPRGRDDFRTFLKKFMWDSMVYDQAGMEVVPDRMGRPCEFYAVDGATLRLADMSRLKFDESEDIIRYVQIYDGMVVAEYTARELCFGIRNPRTDIRLAGYGVSESEMLITAVTALLYSWEYNTKFFTQGSSAKGILNFKGAIPEKSMRNFRRHWYTQLTGISNSWRTPITNAEEIQWINLQQSQRDAEFVAWMDFLIKVTAGMFNTDPLEINFKYGNAGQKSTMNEAGNREKIQESKERGLRPLLEFAASCINQYLIWPINENFEFRFVGLDAMTRSELVDYHQKRVKSLWTVDELRAEEDMPPLPDGKGEVILDATWLQFAQAKDAAAQGGGMGMPGMEGGEEGDQGGDGFDEDEWAKLLGEPEDQDQGQLGGAQPGQPQLPAPGQAGPPAQPGQPQVAKSFNVTLDL